MKRLLSLALAAALLFSLPLTARAADVIAHSVRFSAVDERGEPVINLIIRTAGRDEPTIARMEQSSDPGYCETTNHLGQTQRLLPVGNYTGTAMTRFGGEELERTFDFSVTASKAVQVIEVVWREQTPAEHAAALKNRVEFTLTDSKGRPVTDVVAKYYIPSDSGSRADAEIIYAPLLHTDSDGVLRFPLPGTKRGRLLLFSDSNQNVIKRRGYTQSVPINLKSLSGTVRVKVTWSPEQSAVIFFDGAAAYGPL